MTTEKHIINKLNFRFNRKLFIKIIEYISDVKILKVNNYVNVLNHLGKISNDDIDFIIEFLIVTRKINKTDFKLSTSKKLNSNSVFAEFKSYYYDMLTSNQLIFKHLFDEPVISLKDDKISFENLRVILVDIFRYCKGNGDCTKTLKIYNHLIFNNSKLLLTNVYPKRSYDYIFIDLIPS